MNLLFHDPSETLQPCPLVTILRNIININLGHKKITSHQFNIFLTKISKNIFSSCRSFIHATVLYLKLCNLYTLANPCIFTAYKVIQLPFVQPDTASCKVGNLYTLKQDCLQLLEVQWMPLNHWIFVLLCSLFPIICLKTWVKLQSQNARHEIPDAIHCTKMLYLNLSNE